MKKTVVFFLFVCVAIYTYSSNPYLNKSNFKKATIIIYKLGDYSPDSCKTALMGCFKGFKVQIMQVIKKKLANRLINELLNENNYSTDFIALCPIKPTIGIKIINNKNNITEIIIGSRDCLKIIFSGENKPDFFADIQNSNKLFELLSNFN